MDLSSYYRVRPSFSVVAHSGDIVELRRGIWNPVSITLTDRSGSGKLFRSLELMTGDRTMEEIANEVQLSDREAKELLGFLSRHRVLETEPSSAFDLMVDVSHATLANGTEARPRFDRIELIGNSELAEEIERVLGNSGLGASCHTVDHDRIAALTNQDLTLVEDPLAFRDEVAKYDDWKGCLVVVGSLTIDPILLRNINRVCLHHRITWLHAAADGPFLIVGPTFLPGRSSCYECFETRVTMSMREHESYVRYKKALAQRTVRLGSPHLGSPFNNLLASHAALEIVNLIASGSNFTISKALTIYLPVLGFSFNEVLRVPGCAACSPITEQREQGLYFDVQGLVKSLYAEQEEPVAT